MLILLEISHQLFTQIPELPRLFDVIAEGRAGHDPQAVVIVCVAPCIWRQAAVQRCPGTLIHRDEDKVLEDAKEYPACSHHAYELTSKEPPDFLLKCLHAQVTAFLLLTSTAHGVCHIMRSAVPDIWSLAETKALSHPGQMQVDTPAAFGVCKNASCRKCAFFAATDVLPLWQAMKVPEGRHVALTIRDGEAEIAGGGGNSQSARLESYSFDKRFHAGALQQCLSMPQCMHVSVQQHFLLLNP